MIKGPEADAPGAGPRDQSIADRIELDKHVEIFIEAFETLGAGDRAWLSTFVALVAHVEAHHGERAALDLIDRVQAIACASDNLRGSGRATAIS